MELTYTYWEADDGLLVGYRKNKNHGVRGYRTEGSFTEFRYEYLLPTFSSVAV